MQGNIQSGGPKSRENEPSIPGIIQATSYFIVDKESGKIIERLSTSGKRVLRDQGLFEVPVLETGPTLSEKRKLTDQDMVKGVSSGRFEVKTQEEILAALDRKKSGIGITGGGDCAGIADFLASFQQHLNPELTMLGVRNAGKGLMVSPSEFQSKLIIVDGLAAKDFEGQSSTPLGSAREDALARAPENTKANIGGFGFFYTTGGNDTLGLAERIARAFPKMVVVATFKSIDGDGCIKGIPFSLGDTLDLDTIQDGFKTLGLKVKGRFSQAAVETKVDEGKTWTLTTDEKQKWIIQHDLKNNKVSVSEGRADVTLPRGALLYRKEETPELKLYGEELYAKSDKTVKKPILRRTLEAKTEEDGSITTMCDLPCQMLGFHTAVRDYQKAIWAAAQNADTHEQWHMVETFGRGAGKLAYEAARRFPPNFDELPPEEQRKITEFHRAIMILVPEKPTTLRSLAAEAKAIHDREGNVVIVAAEGFMPPELKYEMKRLAKDKGLKDRWVSGGLKADEIPSLIEVVDDGDPRADLKKILKDRELAVQFAKTVWESKLDSFGNVEKLAGIRKYVIQALEKLAGAKKVNELMENYEARGATPSKLDRIMGQKKGEKAAELVNQGEKGGVAVVYFEGMDPFTQPPRVVPLVGVSDKNNLNNQELYPTEILRENGVFWKEEDLSKYLKAA